MRTRLLLLVSLLTLSAPVWALTINGRVFVDANSDGAWQAGGAARRAIVSDGAALVTTGPDGGYALDTQSDTVFCVNPTGTWPEGSFWRRIEAGTTSADFPMLRREQMVPFYFVQGTDLHIRPDVAEKMAQYVNAINSFALPVAFVVHTGDLVVDTNLSTVPRHALCSARMRRWSGLRMPLRHVPGNRSTSGSSDRTSLRHAGLGQRPVPRCLRPDALRLHLRRRAVHRPDGTDIVDRGLPSKIPRPA